MMCSNGQLIFTDPNNPDSDGDGLLDGEEIVVTYGQKYIEGAGNEGHSISAVYFTFKTNPRDVDSDADGISDSEDILPLKPFIDGKYNRDFAIYYANQYYNTYNPNYKDMNPTQEEIEAGITGGDCANFISQCLFFGGIPMDNKWFYEDENNFGNAWAFASKNYSYFSKKYGDNIIELKSKFDMYNVIKEYNIKKGDLVYFCEYGKPYHSAMIYDIKSDNIIYVAHSSDKKDGDLLRYLSWCEDNNKCSVKIVHLGDNL